MAEIIYVDANGNELLRETKGRGRPPRGSEKQDNGDIIVHPVVDTTFHPEYVDIVDGVVVSRSSKGRGKAKPGYVKMVDGEHKGHWVKSAVDELLTTEPVMTQAPEAVVIEEETPAGEAR